jgi:plastocyanin
MRKWLALLVACLALALVIAGCGGDDDDDGGGNGSAAKENTSTGGGGGGAGAKVAMKNIQFNPQNVTIKAGDTVTWTNDEDVSHDVSGAGKGTKFSSGAVGGMSKGDTFKFTFKNPGTYAYVCRVHAPGMHGTIKVQ